MDSIMGHLVPEKRLNKNGVAVTKHVLAQTAVGAGRKPLPAPAPVNAERSKVLTREALQRLRSAGIKLVNNGYATKNLYHLANKNPDLLERVVAHVESADPSEQRVWDNTLSSEFRHSVGNDQHDYSRRYEIDLKAIPVGTVVMGMRDDYESEIGSTINSWRMLVDEEKRTPEYIAAALIVTEYDRRFVPAYGYKIDVDKYADEIGYIAERPEAVAPILDELVARETLDQGTIEAILDISVTSLRDGAL